jgi:probable HAF family extracellular repeat protein
MSCRRFVVIASLLLSAFSFAQSNIKTIQPTFTNIDVPGHTLTYVDGLNSNGDMVGWYADSDSGPYHAFVIKGGTMTLFDHPNSVSTVATGINDSGLIIGFAGDFYDAGFTYDGNNFTQIQPAKRSRTILYGINNAGEIVGGAGTPYDTIAIDLKNGKFKTIKFPGGYNYAYATGINNFGEIVGWTDTKDAFVYSGGKFTRIDVPGSTYNTAWGVNDSGIVIGSYFFGGTYYSFALISGAFYSFGYPGATGTFAQGINAAGQVVGAYTMDSNLTYHGFITSPITAAVEH